jgi:peptidoglycan/xylan/chitin deacetylase (PgdA/CDA1 family)
MRAQLKSLVEKALRRSFGDPARMRSRALILAYHNVVPDGFEGQGDRSLHLALGAFRRQLDLLQAHCRVTSLSDLLENGPAHDRLSVAITFDDAYAGAVELALPELAQRGLPATLFVAPGLLGARTFWWDELAQGPGGLSAARRRAAIDTHGGRSDAIRAALNDHGSPASLPRWYACADEEPVRSLARFEGLTLGAHSWSHPNLTRLTAQALIPELTRPLEWLASTTARTVRTLAYPYGIHSPEVQAAARAAGYDAALRVEGGWFRREAGDPLVVPRFNIPAGLSEDGFMLRLSGVIPL